MLNGKFFTMYVFAYKFICRYRLVKCCVSLKCLLYYALMQFHFESIRLHLFMYFIFASKPINNYIELVQVAEKCKDNLLGVVI